MFSRPLLLGGVVAASIDILGPSFAGNLAAMFLFGLIIAFFASRRPSTASVDGTRPWCRFR